MQPNRKDLLMSLQFNPCSSVARDIPILPAKSLWCDGKRFYKVVSATRAWVTYVCPNSTKEMGMGLGAFKENMIDIDKILEDLWI